VKKIEHPLSPEGRGQGEGFVGRVRPILSEGIGAPLTPTLSRRERVLEGPQTRETK